jgi:alkaline phosphatase D
MATGKATWNLLASGTVMAHIDEKVGPAERYWTDGWNGYPVARDRLLDMLMQTAVRNPVVLSGDIHTFLVASLNQSAAKLDSRVVASEFTTTSISSQSTPQKAIDERLPENPNLLFADAERRGYLRLEILPQRLRVELVGLDDVRRADSGASVLRTYFVEDGKPGPVQG